MINLKTVNEQEEKLMREKVALRKNKDMVARDFEDETVLVPIFKTSKEADYIYTLNPSARRVWDLINGKRTTADIKKIILKEFDTTPEEVDKEMSKIVKDFKKIKAVK